jgi:thiamine-monophosphate kinase
VTADIVLLGSVPTGKALLRSGARAGDVIYVSGELGGAAAELRALERHPAAFRRKDKARHPHLYPEPRLDLGRKLLQRGLATAAIDLSDGLSTDLAHLCEESGLAALVNREAVPMDPDPRLGATLDDALHGGEDYELLFTARPNAVIPGKLAGIRLYPIGRMTARARRAGPLVEICDSHGKRTPLAARGWEHFR